MMKKKCSYLIAIAGVVTMITMAFKGNETTLIVNDYYEVSEPLAYYVPTSEETIDSINKALGETAFELKTDNSFIDFKEALGLRESNGDYQSVNSYGYMGKYQFGKGTLKFIGVKKTDGFLQNPALQERAFVAYIQKNKWILRREIKKYVGKTVHGIKITESGMLAAAHLGGAGAVQDFLRSKGRISFTDGYGTNIQSYFKEFANYDLSGITADKNPKV